MNRSLTLAALAVLSAGALAQDYTEGFDDITTLAGNGWADINNSTAAAGNWFQGNGTVFPANSPGGATPANSYIGCNYQRTSGTTGTETLSDWLITPMCTMNNGDTFSFFTRTVTSNAYPDRLQLRMSTNGASTNVGSTPESLGDFTTLLVDINPNEVTGAANYPETWTQYTATVSGLGGPTSGRFALRYYVHNGGLFGANSNYIGVDDAAYSAVPEPATLSVLALGGLLLMRRRNRK